MVELTIPPPFKFWVLMIGKYTLVDAESAPAPLVAEAGTVREYPAPEVLVPVVIWHPNS